MLFERDAHPLPLASPSCRGSPPEEKIGSRDGGRRRLKDLRTVPIYFASSYSFVKPYVTGFDTNVLDAPSLKKTRLDTNWKQTEGTGAKSQKAQKSSRYTKKTGFCDQFCAFVPFCG